MRCITVDSARCGGIDRNMWTWLVREHALYDVDAHLRAGLPDDLPQPLSHFAAQHIVSVLRHPNVVKPVIKFGMASSTIGHEQFPWIHAEADRLEAGGLNPENGKKGFVRPYLQHDSLSADCIAIA